MNSILNFILPSEDNNYRAHLIRHNSLALYLVIAICFSLLMRYSGSFRSVLGFATDITTNRLFYLSNEQRSKQGLQKLRYSEQLAEAAQKKAEDMFSKNYWSHYAPDGTAPWNFIKSTGYSYVYAGENLAKNFLFSDAVVDAWMNSPTHKENMLRKDYEEVGLAIVNGILNGEQTTLVVQMFGTPAEIQEVSRLTEPPVVANAIHTELPTGSRSVLAEKTFKNPFRLSVPYVTIIGIIMLLALLFIIDLGIAVRWNLVRINGTSIGHLLFLGAILVGITLIITRSGIIL